MSSEQEWQFIEEETGRNTLNISTRHKVTALLFVFCTLLDVLFL
jgi:hypothetical protein